jgi:hypothetical protein
MSDSQVGRLTLDPGGEISLRWTKAWNGLLTIKGQDFRASHSHHVHDYYSIRLVDHGEAEGDVVGLPPYAYYAQVRTAWAKVFLRHGYPLSAVAMQLGYSDQSHFHRQFRELSATTPGRYARALHSVFGDQPMAEPFNGARPLIPADSG